MNDPNAVIRAVTPLMMLYGDPTASLPEPQQAAYWQVYADVLAGVTADALNAAVLLVAQTHVFPSFPKPAVILDAARQMIGGRTGLEAWGDVVQAVAEHGYYRPPEGYAGPGTWSVDLPSYRWTFSDPLVLEVVSSMGWPRLCFSENPGTDASQFARAYDALKERREKERTLSLPPAADAHPAPRLEGRGTALIAQLAQAKKVAK